MAQIPAHKLEEIRNRLDIVDVISSYVELKRAGRNYVGLCPFHPEKTPSFTVSPEKQFYHCFGCQSGGNLFTFVMQAEGISFPESAYFLARRAGMELNEVPSSPAEQRQAQLRARMLEANAAAREYFQFNLWQSPAGRNALAYLRQRGLTDQTMQAFKLGYAPASWSGLKSELARRGIGGETGVIAGLLAAKEEKKFYDLFRERIIFPIMNSQGETLGFGGRLLIEGEPRYLNTPETMLFHKGSLLYGLPQALPAIRRHKEVLLVEGYMDVLLLHQHSFTHSVAPLGTALTGRHISLLRGRPEKITLAFDGDTGGEDAAIRSLELLEKEGFRVAVALFPAGRDPAEVLAAKGADYLEKEILAKSLSVLEYRLHILQKGFDLRKDGERLGFWQKARLLLAASAEPVERENQLKKIAAEIGSSLEVLRGDLEKIIHGKPLKKTAAPLNGKKSETEPPQVLLERELLSALLQHPEFAADVWPSFQPEDFSGGAHREIAACMFSLFQEGITAKAASLLNYFPSEGMHKLIAGMSTDPRFGDAEAAHKNIRSCLRRKKILAWTEEREQLIKAIRESVRQEDISDKLRRVQELKKLEEELNRSGEGGIIDG